MTTLEKLKLDTMQQKRYQSYNLNAMQGMGFVYMSVVMGLYNNREVLYIRLIETSTLNRYFNFVLSYYYLWQSLRFLVTPTIY